MNTGVVSTNWMLLVLMWRTQQGDFTRQYNLNDET